MRTVLKVSIGYWAGVLLGLMFLGPIIDEGEYLFYGGISLAIAPLAYWLCLSLWQKGGTELHGFSCGALSISLPIAALYLFD